MSVSTEGNERDNRAVEENGTACDGSECLQIFKELRQLHEANLRRIDDQVGRDGSEIKLIAMQSWISDLEEQNALFLQTMVQLEQEAGDRVSLLQEGLHRSSRAALAYRTKLDDYDKDDFVEKPILSARNEELQHTQIQKLESDITNLVELIRRVREENRLDATGLTFNEVTFEDIFGTDDMISEHTDCTVHDSQISTSISISWETTQSTHQNQGKDAVIAYLNDEIRRLHLDVEKCKDDKGREVSKMEEEILMLKCDNKQKDEQIHRLSNEDIRESLTAEVASKHDEIVALRREKLNLEEKCHELEMKVRLKDEVILKLRNDLKASGFKRVSCSADHRNVVNNSQQEEQSLHNVSQHVDNNSNNNQQVKAPVNKSDYQLKQVPASPDEPQHSFPYQYQSTPKKSSTFCSKKKLCDVGNTDEQQSACDRSLCLEHANWSDIPNATDQRSADGTPYEVCRRNSPSARDGQLSADGKVMFRPERGTVHLKNFDLQAKGRQIGGLNQKGTENNNMDTAEHLKNLLLISDNTVKKQQENISGLQDTVKKYESDLNDLQIKVEQMEVELKDSKLKYIQQITDQDAMINDLRKTARTSQTEVEMLKEKCEKYERSAEAVQEERENLKTEMEKLKNNLMSREKVAANQEEIINILQDSVNIAQKEQQDLQQKLKDDEAGKEKLLNTLQEERKKAENLQEALMVTKQQLEDLQGNKYEVIIKDRIIRRLHLDLSEIKSQYSNCYAEVVKQEKVLDTLRDSIDFLRTEIVNMEQDIRLLELHLAEKLKVLYFSKTRESEKWTAESQKKNESCKDTLESLNGKVSFLNNLLKEKSEVLAHVEADNEVLQNTADHYNSLMAEANQEKENLKLEIKGLQGQLEKFEVNYQYAMEDGKKYQNMILEAANREVRLQKEFTERERQVLEKLRSSQTEELRICDVVDFLNTELLNIKTELAEREAQLQSVACQNHLSTQTIEKLQTYLELKDETIDCLQGNMNEMNLNLLTTVKMLKGKEQLIQNLQSQNTELQRQLESENLRSAVCEEVQTLEMEAVHLKSQVKRCTQLQDGTNVEVRECLSVPETWWWDDFWQM